MWRNKSTAVAIAFLFAAAPAAGQTPLAVQAQALPAPVILSAGIATPAKLGLMEDLWRGLNGNVWKALLTAQPERQASPTLRQIAAQVIASRAPLPAAIPGASDFTLLRARALSGYSNADMLGLFVAAQPDSTRTPALRDLLRDQTFATDGARGCALPNLDGNWPLYCAILASRLDEVQLQADLLREKNANSEESRILDAALTGNGKNLPEKLSLYDVRMLGTHPKAPLTGEAASPLAQRAKYSVLAARGGDDKAMHAAEWLATYGYADAQLLDRTYHSGNWAKPPAKGNSASYRAYTYLSLQEVTANRAQLLSDMITSGGAASVLGVRGALLMPTLQQIPPTTAAGAAAPNLFALAAAQGDSASAAAWYDTVVTLAENLDAAAEWQARLWPVAVAMGLDNADAGDLNGWFTDATALPAERALPLADILTLLEARGIVVPRVIWSQAMEASGSAAPGKSDPAQLELLKSAAAGGRQGEVILRSLILADTDLSQAPVPTIAAIIRAYTALGLNEIADQLTVEALLALLFPPA